MAKAGAPKGNKNATKNKLWTDALRYELSGNQNVKKIRAIAKKVVEMAQEGDMKAVQEIGNRLDGKPIQAIEGTGEDGNFEMTLTVQYVDSKSTD